MRIKIAVSIGDLNGVSPAIAFASHKILSENFDISYCCNKTAMLDAAKLLKISVPTDMKLVNVGNDFTIKPKQIDAKCGAASFDAFVKACDLADSKEVDAVVTLPINKQSWNIAGINFAGHTEYLRDRYDMPAIMMLGCGKMMVALYTDHIPLKNAIKNIKLKPLTHFLVRLVNLTQTDKIAVLGINPHAGDNGVMGSEDFIIADAVSVANRLLKREILHGPFPPDTAFTPKMRKKYKYFAAMTHDHGLAPLKALYFDKSINVSLGLPIIRASVDHGTAFDIAYTKTPSIASYLEAFKYVQSYIQQK